MRLYGTEEANRAAALAALEAYAPAAGNYGATRNWETGPRGRRTTSRLSPFLRHRLLLEPEVVDAVTAAHGQSAVRKFVQEVYWRTYFKGWLQMRPAVWRDYRNAVRAASREVDGDSALRRRWREAVGGRTGIACFDHWSRELRDTGYLHNHARMWFASIWIFTLRLPWVLGAAFFLRHLLDGDAASNTLSWRWVGGLHTRGKIYVARASNIEQFTGGRFAPHGELNERPEALRESVVYERRPVEPMPETPPADGRAFVLCLTDDDCLPERSALADARIVGVAGLWADGCPDGADYSEPVREFKRAAVRDAVGRASGKFGCAGELFALDANTSGPPPGLAEWCARRGADAVVLARPPVGVNADALAGGNGPELPVFRVDRPWDAAHWPLATAGYFNFRKKLGL